MSMFFFRKLVQRIREEFEEAPGLRLTTTEAARFWGLDRATCERLLEELLLIGFLRQGPDQRYYHGVWQEEIAPRHCGITAFRRRRRSVQLVIPPRAVHHHEQPGREAIAKTGDRAVDPVGRVGGCRDRRQRRVVTRPIQEEYYQRWATFGLKFSF